MVSYVMRFLDVCDAKNAYSISFLEYFLGEDA